MRIKPVTPLGLAFVFAVLLAGWASAANGLQSSPNPAGALASPTAKQLHGKSASSSSAHTASQKGTGDSTTQSRKQSTTHSTTQSGQLGGSVLRVHDNCPLPPTASLTGNWTHGDYVSAWAATGDHVATKAAAQSSCGMPANSNGHSSNKGHHKGGKAHAKDNHGHKAGKGHAKTGKGKSKH